VTASGEGHAPGSYAAALKQGSLRGARIGALLPLFGTTPEDQRAGSVARTALAELESAGARVEQVATDPLPAEGDVSVIRYEFKFNLDAYLRATPRAPVRSLAEILDKGVYLKALEQAFRGSNAVATLDSDDYRAAVARQADLRKRLLALLEEKRLDAFAYPTVRRTAAKIGEPQQGGNCAASAATGLPAISVPAGFADDGMPVGIEFLGRPFSELDLLKLAYAYEQATHHRHPPALTPRLP
jgi:Asp-tRNA(Asn)/Glu-tRNA(Gln) amidotransferase A subunit family amidase